MTNNQNVVDRLIEARSILADAITDASMCWNDVDKATCFKFGYFKATQIIPDKSQHNMYSFHEVYDLKTTMEDAFSQSESGSAREKRSQEILSDIVDFLGDSNEDNKYLDEIIVYPKGSNTRAYKISYRELENIIYPYKEYLDEKYQKIVHDDNERLKEYDKPKY